MVSVFAVSVRVTKRETSRVAQLLIDRHDLAMGYRNRQFALRVVL